MEKQDTRQLILDQAIELFSESGFTCISIRDLAQKVGIKSASIYHYFNSKEEIFSAIVDSYHLQVFTLLEYPTIDAIRAKIEGMSFDEVVAEFFPPLDKVDGEKARQMVRISLLEQFTHPRVREFWGEAVIARHVKYWKQTLDVLVESGRLPPNDTLLAAEVMTRVRVSVIIQFAHHQPDEDTDFSLSEKTLLSYICDRLKRGEY